MKGIVEIETEKISAHGAKVRKIISIKTLCEECLSLDDVYEEGVWKEITFRRYEGGIIDEESFQECMNIIRENVKELNSRLDIDRTWKGIENVII